MKTILLILLPVFLILIYYFKHKMIDYEITTSKINEYGLFMIISTVCLIADYLILYIKYF